MRLRLSGKCDVGLSNNLSAELEYEHRFDQYLTTFDKALIEPSIVYKLNKKAQFGVQFRVMYDQDQVRNREYKQRFGSYFRYKFEVDDFDLKVKTAIQYGFDDLTNSTFNNTQKLINRNSIEIDYNWFGKKIKPSIAYEFFFHINHPNGGIINQWRLKTDLTYELSKSSKINLYYAFENEFNIVAPVDSHIMGIGYAYSF